MKKSYYKNYSTFFIWHYIQFEINSWLGRHFFSKKPKVKSDQKLLNLGSSTLYFEGWCNADFFPNFIRFKFWKHFLKKESKLDWQLDFRYPLKCKNDFWDGIFTEHTLEHLYPHEVEKLLCELHRVLKPNAWIRIALPDLKKYIDFYNDKSTQPEFMKIYGSGCDAIRNLTQNYAHLSLWDSETLTLFLENAGFRNISVTDFREGTDKKLLKDKEISRWETFYMEAQK
jgi:predicted SAM-dependent methyltransferase